MTEEVVAACEAAHEAGADEIVVKDGHGDASNIDPLKMPEYVTLIRGKSGHPYNMMYGIDDSYDGVLYLGYHAPAGDPNFSISHHIDRKQPVYSPEWKSDERVYAEQLYGSITSRTGAVSFRR